MIFKKGDDVITTDFLIKWFTWLALWNLAFIITCAYFKNFYIASFLSGTLLYNMVLIGLFLITKNHEEHEPQ